MDIPEITLVAILDADKEGFLRSETSLIHVHLHSFLVRIFYYKTIYISIFIPILYVYAYFYVMHEYKYNTG